VSLQGLGGHSYPKWKNYSILQLHIKGKKFDQIILCKKLKALAIQHWRPYLLGRKFTVKTDQKSLREFSLQNITTMDWQNSAAKLFSDDLQQNREAQKGFSYNNGVLLYEGCCLVLSAKSSWTPI
jgi:hypothetical protein